MAAYIAAHHIKMRSTRVTPHEHQMQAVSDLWRCVLSRVDNYLMDYGEVLDVHQFHPTLTVMYVSVTQPLAAEVLGRLSADSAGIRHKTFEHWCEDLCLDSDSRKVELEYNTRKVEAERLRLWLAAGDSAYNALLYKVEGGAN